MTPDQIKAAAIEAAAEAMYLRQQLIFSPGARRSWDDAITETKTEFLKYATAAIEAYERTMVRPLADAPAYDPSGHRTRVLLWVPGWAVWCQGAVHRTKDNAPRAFVAGCPWDDDDFPLFRLFPDAPEAKP